MIESFVISVIASAAFALAHERAQRISQWAIRCIASTLPKEIRDSRLEEWSAVSRDIEGGTWKILHALGCAWFCRFDIAAKYLGLKPKPKWLIWDLKSTRGSVRLVFRYPDGIAAIRKMTTAFEGGALHTELDRVLNPVSENAYTVSDVQMFVSFTYPPDIE